MFSVYIEAKHYNETVIMSAYIMAMPEGNVFSSQMMAL